MARDRTMPRLALALAALSLVSPLLPDWMIFIAAISLAKGLVVLGLLLLWRTGLVSFGQSLYYALGAYAVGLAYRHYGLTDAFVAVALAAAVSGLVAVLLGFLLAAGSVFRIFDVPIRSSAPQAADCFGPAA